MNSDQIKSLVRAFLVFLFGGSIGAWLIAHGVAIDDNFITMATGIVSGVVGVAWSQITHKTA